MNAADQVTSVSGVLGLLLALIALFTSAQHEALQSQLTRQGGPQSGAGRRIAIISAALAVVSVGAILSLFPIVLDILDTYGTDAWQPTFWVFLLVCLLLAPLCVWQVLITVQASRL